MTMATLLWAMFLFCVGLTAFLFGVHYIKKQWQFKTRAVEVIGKWAGFKETNHRTDIGFRYSSTVIYKCPFSKHHKTLHGMSSTNGYSWRHSGDPVLLFVDRIAPHTAQTKNLWKMSVALGFASGGFGLAILMLVVIKEVSYLNSLNWRQSSAIAEFDTKLLINSRLVSMQLICAHK